MNYEQKYRKLRAAILALLDMPEDDKGDLLALMASIHREKTNSPEERASQKASLELLVALIETHEGPAVAQEKQA